MISFLGIFWPNFIRIEYDDNYLWSDRKSESYKHFDNLINTFGKEPESLVLLLVSKIPFIGLMPQAMNEAYMIYNSINEITTNIDGIMYRYKDVCSLTYPSSNVCESEQRNIFPILYVMCLMSVFEYIYIYSVFDEYIVKIDLKMIQIIGLILQIHWIK